MPSKGNMLRLVDQLHSPARVFWIASLLWIGIIALESTDLFSGSHTGHLLSALLAALGFHSEEQTVSHLNIVLRKLGHFVGYGVLSWLLFRAWKATLPVASSWALRWVVLALFSTTLVASADEWHQTTIPSRVGRVQDVLLDDSGAAVTQCLLFFFP
jgi:VanZ family protein